MMKSRPFIVAILVYAAIVSIKVMRQAFLLPGSRSI